MNPLLDCPCHLQLHDGNGPTFEELLALSAQDHDCLQGDIEGLVYLIRDQLSKDTTEKEFLRQIGKLNFSARRLAFREYAAFRPYVWGDANGRNVGNSGTDGARPLGRTDYRREETNQ